MPALKYQIGDCVVEKQITFWSIRTVWGDHIGNIHKTETKRGWKGFLRKRTGVTIITGQSMRSVAKEMCERRCVTPAT